MNIIRKADEILLKALKILSGAFMGIMVGMVVIQVVFRYLLKIACPWAEEFARLALVWCVVLASAAGIRLLEHPYIEVLVKKFPSRVQKILTVFIYLVIAAFGVVLTVFGIEFTTATSMDYMTSLGYHKNYFYAPSFVGGILYTIYSIGHVVTTCKQLKKEESGI